MDEIGSGGLTWSLQNVKRLISPYPAHKKVDAILERLGEDFGEDEVHAIDDGDDEPGNASSDEECAEHGDAAVAEAAGHGDAAVAEAAGDIVSLTAPQADAMQQSQITMAALQSSAESLRSVGAIKAMQGIQDWQKHVF